MSPWLVTKPAAGRACHSLRNCPTDGGYAFLPARTSMTQKQHIEFGIDPDKKVDMSKEDENNDLDTIIEEARKILKVTF